MIDDGGASFFPWMGYTPPLALLAQEENVGGVFPLKFPLALKYSTIKRNFECRGGNFLFLPTTLELRARILRRNDGGSLALQSKSEPTPACK